MFSEELNLNEAFRKNVTFNSIEIHKNQAFAFFSKNAFFEKLKEAQIGSPVFSGFYFMILAWRR